MSTKLKKSNFSCLPALLMFLLLSCSVDKSPEELLQGRTVLNIGHAGMGFSSIINPFSPLPDNSMGALLKAMSLGADGVEVDVQMSRDSILILYHDKELDTKTGLQGCVNNLLAKDIIGADYETGFPFNLYHDEKIIGLDSLFIELNKRDTFPWVYLDIHSYNYCDTAHGYDRIDEFARAIVRCIETHSVPPGKICPTSTFVPMLLEIRKANPEIKLWYEEDTRFDKGLRILDTHKFNGIVMKRSVLPSTERLSELGKRGVQFVAFGGKTRGAIEELLTFRPDVLQVNNVSALKEIIDEAGIND